MLLFWIAATAIVGGYAVETTSWWVKGACPPGSIGLYVSRSNIYLYCGRFFNLAFNFLLAFSIEQGADQREIIYTLGGGFLASAAVHYIFLRGGPLTQWTLSLLNRVLVLPNWQKVYPVPEGARPSEVKARLLWGTVVATLAFSLGASLPLLLAVAVPEYRMSLSYIGQIVNAAGTLTALFLVDQLLFKELDKGSLVPALPSYGLGRALAFGIAGIVCCALGWLLTLVG